jgi:hypothetical protein
MIDDATYKLMHGAEAVDEYGEELDEESMRAEEPPADPFVLLLPATIRGFGFHNKKWSKF